MNNEELIEFSNSITVELQKRNGIVLDNQKKVALVLGKRNYLFTKYEIALYIFQAFLNLHSIPQNYVGYYIKPLNIKHSRKLNKTVLKEIRAKLKNYISKDHYLAGGSLARCYLVNENSRKYVIKESSGWHAQKLFNELNFILRLSDNKHISRFVPKIIDYKKVNDYISLKLKYYPYNTLSYNILFNKVTSEKAWSVTCKVLQFVQSNLWEKNKSTPDPQYIQKFYIERIRKNINMLLNRTTSFNNIVTSERIDINSKQYLNLLEILKKIEASPLLLHDLTPVYLSDIWGDLHPNNIIMTKSSFILIDPRGNTGDYMYDLAKIYHTYGPGRYDFLDNDLFTIRLELTQNVKFLRKFNTNHPAWIIYNNLEKEFDNNLKMYIADWDSKWEIRWHFLNFCIYATMPLFLIKNNAHESRALMGYTNAVIMGNIFLKKAKQYGYIS